MEVNFGSSAPFSLGVEEEFQLVSAESYELVSRYDEVAEAAAPDVEAKPELMKSVLEVATHIAATVPEAIEEAARMRAGLGTAAAEQGARIASAGTHPFSRWEHQEVTEADRYLELIEKMRWVAEREIIFGLHVHVGMPDARQAMAVANGLRTWLPELLALSANSPFWQGRDTGLASTRTQVFQAFPRSGLPPAFVSFEEFERVVERGVRTNCFKDYTYIWWDLRPHPRLGTIEIRICDAQTRLDSAAAIVALVQSLVATLAERYEEERTLPVQPVTLIGENKWRAARFGLDAKLIDLERDTERSAPEAVRTLVELAEPAARRLGCAEELAAVERLLERGSGAEEQRRVQGKTGSLLAVAKFIADETVRDL